MKLIVGLGNPGEKYKNTRHNAGFMAIDRLAKAFGFDDFRQVDKFKALVAEGNIGDEKVILAKPQTFMNLSGQSVRAIETFYKLNSDDILVLYDDVEIPLEKLRIRKEGSAGGHNGMGSVMQELSTLAVPRVRLGIKPEKPFAGALEDYVLGNLSEDEKAALEIVIDGVPIIAEAFIKGKLEDMMQAFN